MVGAINLLNMRIFNPHNFWPRRPLGMNCGGEVGHDIRYPCAKFGPNRPMRSRVFLGRTDRRTDNVKSTLDP